jgi:hypothetical protein
MPGATRPCHGTEVADRERLLAAVRRSGSAFTDLVRSRAGESERLVTSDWTVADTAAHLLSLASYYVTLFDPQAARLPIPGLSGLLSNTTVDSVRTTNSVVLSHLRDRDAVRLADDIDSSIAELLDLGLTLDLTATVPWLGDSRVPAAGVLAHIVNEFLIHGRDMARTLRHPWSMPDPESALFFDEFLVGMIRNDHGRLLETRTPTPARPITVEFRSAHTTPTKLALRGRRVTIGGPDDAPDARVTFRPAAFTLMLFGRRSVAATLLRRDIIPGGPRPWLLPPFLRVVHMPDN